MADKILQALDKRMSDLEKENKALKKIVGALQVEVGKAKANIKVLKVASASPSEAAKLATKATTKLQSLFEKGQIEDAKLEKNCLKYIVN